MAIFIKHSLHILEVLKNLNLIPISEYNKIRNYPHIECSPNNEYNNIILKKIINYCYMYNEEKLSILCGKIEISKYGIIELGILLQDNYNLAIIFLVKYQIFFSPISKFQVINNKCLEFKIEPNLYSNPRDYGYRFSVEYQMSQLLSILQQIFPKPLKANKIFLKYKDCTYGKYLKDYFECDVVFNADENRICFNIPTNNLKNRLKDFEKNEIKIKINNILNQVVAHKTNQNYLEQKIIEIIEESPDEMLDEESIASKLNMHPRTLRRKLKDEGITFREIITNFKMKKSILLITTTKLNNKQIAFLVGFKNSASFSKAFKNWTGKSPQEFKNEYS
ncbi:helix-turn-helix domain-containing protein [Acinetobacter pittii]|uniref:helix-turn-helix domain-containing protein n=1 Tax=Acinetobacter TaxID=469 RepID=UPI002380B2AE|nr:helix-turn-helix transcriptional regulator [Acinetobacter pittii]MDE4040768.1 helix-turn-helix transcriptional regulator [Acinetobacter pittii]WPP87445.1 helix-turn-helix transcriptional regulator [Acinetobacter pittii]